MTKNVYILTFCERVESLYGTTLIFKTLRVGFPQAEIHVVDNASLLEVRPTIKAAAEECDAHFTQLEQRIAHHDFIERMLTTQAKGTAIFLDPDLCFWENVELWSFNVLMAGRLIPKFNCTVSNCITHPRLHTSFLWIPDVSILLEKIGDLINQYFEFSPSFRPIMYKADKVWQRFDTAGTLYNALPAEQMYAFTERELDAYDHLFCGTHLGLLASRLEPFYARKFVELHKQAQVDYKQVKGAWRMQEDFFNSLAV